MKMMIAALMLVSTSAFANSGSGPDFDRTPSIKGKECSQDRRLVLNRDGTLAEVCSNDDICNEYAFSNSRGLTTVTARCEEKSVDNGGL
jgi:hypothetical protein